MGSRTGACAIARLRRLVRSSGAGLVHSQGARADFFARLALLGRPNVRLVSTVQMPVEGFDVSGPRRALYRLADRLGRHRVDRFIVVSEALRRRLIEGWRLEPARVSLVYNGVETDVAAPPAGAGPALRRQLGVPEAAPLIGAVGRLVEQKGFADLIAAMPEVMARIPDARLAIVGEGPLRPALAARARAAGMADRVVLAGFRSDVGGFLGALDVLAVPSLREGFPMVTLEAMALGVPIVATAVDGIVEQVTDGHEGLLVPPRDPAALARALITLLTDRALAARLGQAARRRGAEFDVSRTLAATRRVYAELLASGPSSVAR
jgi:glycosyltransferase involved in cell wall biosynthesis